MEQQIVYFSVSGNQSAQEMANALNNKYIKDGWFIKSINQVCTDGHIVVIERPIMKKNENTD